MNTSETISFTALLISVVGWIVSYGNSARLAQRTRCQSRLDDAEDLAFEIASELNAHLMLQGSAPGADDRRRSLQTKSSRLRLIVNDVFEQKLSPEVREHLYDLWEYSTTGPAVDPKYPGMPPDDRLFQDIHRTARALVEASRSELKKKSWWRAS